MWQIMAINGIIQQWLKYNIIEENGIIVNAILLSIVQ